MTIVIGRRRLIVSRIVAPPRPTSFDPPMAINATGGELAHLNGLLAVAKDRRRWEADAILYGAIRPR